jgi:uncharacterized phage protein (TIGR01671 family)
MRDHKYRAWDRTKKQFDYFTLRTALDGFADDCPYVPEGENPNVAEWQPIDEYTGLNDKDGKEIYEGDICSIGENNPYFSPVFVTIDFYNGGFGWHFEKYEANNDGTGTYLSGSNFIGITNHKDLDTKKDLTVVGNIYENPELLK